MRKHTLRKNKQEEKERAAEQHRAVCNFLEKATVKKLLPCDTDKKGKTTPPKIRLLHNLLLVDEPVTYRNEKIRVIGSPATVSNAVKDMNDTLKKFSDGFTYLKKRDISIVIPSYHGGVQIGRYFTCLNSRTGKDLDASEINDVLKATWETFKRERSNKNWLVAIRRTLQRKLKAEALSHLDKKLHGQYPTEFQPLALEHGKVESRLDAVTEAENPSTTDHNRSWTDFSGEFFFDTGCSYILSSETGTGKTTFLRHLQFEILQNSTPIPIFIHASELENAKLRDANDLIRILVDLFRPLSSKPRLGKFLEQCVHGGEILLLVDGLDQIEGSGTDYKILVEALLKICPACMIIASRPFAVISQEQNQKVEFLRLKHFNNRSQVHYFGKNYLRARQLCASSPELMAIPMLAYMICTLIQKNKDQAVHNRAGLYKRFIDYVLAEYEHEQIRSTEDEAMGVRQTLGLIAYEAISNESPYVQKIPLSFSREQANKLNVTVDRILKYGLACLIIDKSEGTDKFLYFSHQSFQEFLAAEWASYDPDRQKFVLEQMWNTTWREVIRFLVGIKGESFLEKIYSYRCKDDCIHSRLLMAADCCAELAEVCNTERVILKKLKSLFPQKYPRDDFVYALSRLNDKGAIDLLVKAAIDKSNYKSINLRLDLRSLAWDILPVIKHKLSRKHCDAMIDWYLKENDDFEPAWQNILKIAEAFYGEHVDRLIDRACSRSSEVCRSPNVTHLPAGKVLYASWHVGRPQIKRVFKYINSNDRNTRYRAICMIRDMCLMHAADHAKRIRIVDGEDEQNDVGGQTIVFTTDEINTLMRYAEADKDKGQFSNMGPSLVCAAMTFLAADNVLSDDHIDWLIGVPMWGNASCSIVVTNPIYDFHHVFNKSHVDKLVAFSLNTKNRIRTDYLKILARIPDKLSTKNTRRLANLLNSDDRNPRLHVLRIFEKLHRRLTVDQIDRIIEMIPVMERNCSFSSVDTLHVIFSILAYIKDKLTSKQVDKIIENFGKIECNIEYHSINIETSSEVHNDQPFSPLPRALTEKQFEEVCNLLKQSPDYKRKLGLDLIVGAGDSIPRSTIDNIFGLLSARDRDLARLALKALGRIHTSLTLKDISKFIFCLNGQGFIARDNAERFLVDVADYLKKEHVAQLGLLLRDKDLDSAESALVVLAEIPDKLPYEYLMDIVGLLARIRPKDHMASQAITTFGEYFKDKHLQQVIHFLHHERHEVQLATLNLINSMSNDVSVEMAEEVLPLLKNSDQDLKTKAKHFLQNHYALLTPDKIEKIVHLYLEHPLEKTILDIMCKIPASSLVKHTSQISKLLDQEDENVKASALKVLGCVTMGLADNDMAKIKAILNSKSSYLQNIAYSTLIKLYRRGLFISRA